MRTAIRGSVRIRFINVNPVKVSLDYCACGWDR